MAKYKYLVVASGDDDFLIRRFVRTALDHLLPKDLRDFNYDRIMASDPGDRLRTVCATPPMMATRRVVHVEDAEKLDKATLKALCEVIDTAAAREVHDVAFLLVYGGGKKPPKSIRDRAGRLETCGTLKPWEAERWVREHARTVHARTLDSRAAGELVGLAGSDTGRLVQEIEKIDLMLPPGVGIGVDAVRGSTGASHGRSIYDFCEAVGRRDVGLAQETLGEVLRFGDFNGVRVVIFLSYHLVDLVRVRAEADGGAAASKMPGWKKKKLDQQAVGWTTAELEALLDALAETDLELKSGAADEVALNAFLMRLAALAPEEGSAVRVARTRTIE